MLGRRLRQRAARTRVEEKGSPVQTCSWPELMYAHLRQRWHLLAAHVESGPASECGQNHKIGNPAAFSGRESPGKELRQRPGRCSANGAQGVWGEEGARKANHPCSRGLACGSAGKHRERDLRDLTDSIWTERAFLNRTAARQQGLMGLQADGHTPLLDRKHRPGLDGMFKILARPACSLGSQRLGELDSSQWGFLIVPAEMC